MAFRAGALGLGLAVALGAAELAVRAAGLAPALKNQYGDNVADPILPFKPRPNSHLTGRNETNEFDYDYRHNRLGLRDVEHATSKPAGVFRILGLGDSFTYGVGVRFEETYLARLERMLNERAGDHPRVEIIKGGIPRFFPQSERLLLEHSGAAFQPDLIVVGFLPNDVADTHQGIGAIRVDPSGFLKTREADEIGRLGLALYCHSHLARRLMRDWLARRIREKYSPQWAEINKDNGFHEPDWQAVEREYATMADIATSIGARLVILHIPQMGPWDRTHDYPARRLGAWAEKHGVGFVSALPAIRRAAATAPPDRPLYYRKDGHCTAKGHAVIAGVLRDYLEGQGWIP